MATLVLFLKHSGSLNHLKSTCVRLSSPGLQYRHVRQFVTFNKICHRNLKRLNKSVIGYMTRDVPRRKVFLKGDAPEKAVKLSAAKHSDVTRLMRLAKPERWRLLGAVGLLLISSVTTMAVPFGMGKIIDIIYSGSSGQADDQMMTRLQTVVTILSGVFLVGAAANFGRIYLMSTSGQRIIRTLRNNLFSSIMRQEVAFFDRTKTGELINRLSTDTSLIGQSVTMNISDGLRSAAQAVGGLSLMFYVSPKLTFVVLGIVPPVAICAVLYGRYVRTITKKTQDSLAAATIVAEERISNIRTVRAFAKEESEVVSYQAKTKDVLLLTYKEALARGLFFGTAGLSGNLIILAVLYYGGGMMNEAHLTVGDLTSFLLYAAYIGVSIGGLSSFYTEMMRGLGASSRLWQLMDRQPAIPVNSGLDLPEPFEGRISFKNVTFNYPMREDMPIFTDLSLEVPAGKVLAVVGPSGSGKSTVGSLILRYYDTIKGSIFIDGVDITKLNPHWLRNHIGTVSQEPVLFSCSIADNISYGAGDPTSVTPADIVAAAKQANAHTFIETFPDKYDTIVGERGLMLSGGQRQRVAIARAIIKNPKILLLDEATSALDAESEFLVQEALDRLMIGRTVITIAHRLSTIKNADLIAVIDQGQVVETGNYRDLMMIEGGLFRKLVERQTIENR